MKRQRPVNLNLMTIKFPAPAIVSILHRISGVFLFLALPFFVWGLHLSFSEAGFKTLEQCFKSPFARLITWLVFSGLIYHFFAGIRHVLMDFHLGESLTGGRVGARLVLLITIIMVILAGVYLW